MDVFYTRFIFFVKQFKVKQVLFYYKNSLS